MSQQRTRKSIAAEQGPRGRSTFKAAGDQCPSMKQQCGDINGSVPLPNTHHKERNGSRSKIPKNLRNDLENALVGLCDVWFEEIKPHLVSNKIKLHVHGAGSASGAGDHRRLAADAPGGCSHLDPGAARDPRQPKFANFASCWSTQPTASRAPCRRPPPPPPRPSSPVKLLCTQNQSPCRGHKAESPWMRAPPLPDRSQKRVPRLCHTYGFPPNITKTNPERFVTEPPVLKDSNHHLHGRQLAFTLPRANCHHSTSITELSKQIKCHVELQKLRVSHDGANIKTFQEAVLTAPTTGPFLQNNAKNTMRNPQKKRQSVPYQTHHFPKHRREIDQRQQCFRNTVANTAIKLKTRASTKSPTPYKQFAQDSKDQKHRRRPTLEGQTSRCPIASSLHRHPCKTQLQLTKHNINFREEPAHQKPSLAATNICRPTLSRTRSSRWQLHQNQKLFQDDLVDIIAERNKNHLEVLFKSPQRGESTSVMNLLRTGYAQELRTKPHAKKIPPWR